MNFVKEILAASSFVILTLLVVSLVRREKSEGFKLFLFWGMVVPILFTTVYLTAATVIKNQVSITKGPVHWHADYDIFVCGQETKAATPDVHEEPGPHLDLELLPRVSAHEEEKVDLQNPSGISNRIGSSDFHEHGDNRIHVEGVVEKLEDISLAKFFEVVGGQLTQSLLRLPTNQGELIVQNGMNCPDGKPGKLQVFVYKTLGTKVVQEKLQNFVDYVISPHSTVPPGDCLVIEFSSEVKPQTDKICRFYEIAIQKGEIQYDE